MATCSLCCEPLNLVATPDCCAISLCLLCSQDYAKSFQNNRSCINCGSQEMALVDLTVAPREPTQPNSLTATKLLLDLAEAKLQAENNFFADLDQQITNQTLVNRLVQPLWLYRDGLIKPYRHCIANLANLIANLERNQIQLNSAVMSKLTTEIAAERFIDRSIGVVEWYRVGPGQVNLRELHVISDRFVAKFTGVVVTAKAASQRESPTKYHSAIHKQTSYLNGVKNGYDQITEGRYLHVYRNYKGRHDGLAQTWMTSFNQTAAEVLAKTKAAAAGNQPGITVSQLWLLSQTSFHKGRRDGWCYKYNRKLVSSVLDPAIATVDSNNVYRTILEERQHYSRDRRHGLYEFIWNSYYLIRIYYQYDQPQFLGYIRSVGYNDMLFERNYLPSFDSVTIRQDQYDNNSAHHRTSLFIASDTASNTVVPIFTGEDLIQPQKYLETCYDWQGEITSQTSY